MSRDEIIRMAREASGGTDWWPVYGDTLERFSALVVAAEREACAKVCESEGARTDASWMGCADAIRARSKT